MYVKSNALRQERGSPETSFRIPLNCAGPQYRIKVACVRMKHLQQYTRQ